MEKIPTIDELKKMYLEEVPQADRGVLNYGHWLETLLLNKIKECNEWEKELTDLTPGGSEFVGDPQGCSAFVRHVNRSNHEKIAKLTKELKQIKK